MKPHPSPPPPPSPPEDPFRYGWRYVKRTLPDGTVDLDQVPLTLEDVLHPEEEDVIPMRDRHDTDCAYLKNVLGTRVAGPAHRKTTADLRIDWNVAGQRATQPDIAVFVGMGVPLDPDAGTLYLGTSGGQCLLVVEVVSPDTRENDVVRKPPEYHAARVPLYVLIDQEQEGGPRSLIAQQWAPAGWVDAPLDAQGRLHLPFARLYLGLEGNRVVCWDDQTGEVLGDYDALTEQLEQADQRNAAQQLDLEEAEKKVGAEMVAREKAEKEARDAAQAREKAEKEARDAAQAREKAEKERADAVGKLREESAARQKAENKTREESEGRAREAREYVLDLGEALLGAPAPEDRAALEALADLDRLLSLRRRVRQAASWADLLAS